MKNNLDESKADLVYNLMMQGCSSMILEKDKRYEENSAYKTVIDALSIRIGLTPHVIHVVNSCFFMAGVVAESRIGLEDTDMINALRRVIHSIEDTLKSVQEEMQKGDEKALTKLQTRSFFNGAKASYDFLTSHKKN